MWFVVNWLCCNFNVTFFSTIGGKMNKDQKNRQLEYIKGQFAWLTILSVFVIFVFYISLYIGFRLNNAVKFHIKTEKEIYKIWEVLNAK